MSIWLLEVDPITLAPLDPVGGWYGPLNNNIECKWIAEETYDPDPPVIVPEIEWPTCRHHRRPDWCHTIVRPPRAMPRGLSTKLVPLDGASGVPPGGVVSEWLDCWHEDPVAAPPNECNYSGNDGNYPYAIYTVRTDADRHNTSADPMAYGPDDYVGELRAYYRIAADEWWGLFSGSPVYSGGAPLEDLPIPCLAIARESLGAPVNKDRSLVLYDPYTTECPGLHFWPPRTWFQDVLQFPGSIKWPERGVMSLEFTLVSLGVAVGDFMRITWATGGFGRVSATVIFNVVPPIEWFWEMRVDGDTSGGADRPANVGDIMRIEIDRRVDPIVVTFFINGTQRHQQSTFNDWPNCNQTWQQFSRGSGGTNRSDALIDWSM